MITNSIPWFKNVKGEKGSGGDCVVGRERSREGWSWCGRGTQENVALDTLKEERQEGQRLSSK